MQILGLLVIKQPIPELQIQVGVGVQGVVLEDVAGLDGLHQAQVVGVDDSRGQTLQFCVKPLRRSDVLCYVLLAAFCNILDEAH